VSAGAEPEPESESEPEPEPEPEPEESSGDSVKYVFLMQRGAAKDESSMSVRAVGMGN
jgi:hypothetical protein